jgi:hypothetical protein
MRFRTIFLFIGVFFGVIWIGYMLLQKPYKNYVVTHEAKVRVNDILKGIQSAPTPSGVAGNEQTAICLWAKDMYLIKDEGTLGMYMDAFDRWRNAAGIFHIKQFSILDSTRIKDVIPETAIVTVDIDGKRFSMRVPKGEQITWESGIEKKAATATIPALNGPNKPLEQIPGKEIPKEEPKPKPIRQIGPNTFTNE